MGHLLGRNRVVRLITGNLRKSHGGVSLLHHLASRDATWARLDLFCSIFINIVAGLVELALVVVRTNGALEVASVRLWLIYRAYLVEHLIVLEEGRDPSLNLWR